MAYLKDWPDFAKFSLLFFVGTIILNIFARPLTELLTPFCTGPIWFGAMIGACLFVFVSLPYIPFSWKRYRQKSFLPLLFNAVIPVMLFYVRFDELWWEFRFWLNRDEYQEVVQLVEEGSLVSTEGVVELPAEYHHLTVGDAILVDRNNGVTRIYFYVYKGGRAFNPVGYVYRSDGQPCQYSDFGYAWARAEPRRPNWSFCLRR
jgi:hypothetical protein